MGLFQSSENRIMVGDYLREMCASFLFAIITGLTFDNPRDIIIPALAIGCGCAILALSERAHMNPVISIAIAACDPEMGWTGLFLRLLAQLLGCIFGGLAAVEGLRDVRLAFAVGTNSRTDIGLAFEVFFTFILVLVVLRTRKLSDGVFSHGFCYTIAILAGNTIFSGNALLNPATAVGIMLGSVSYDSSTEESYLWIYIVGPLIGALLAIVFFQFTELLFDDDEEYSSYEEEETTEYVKGTEFTKMKRREVPGQHNQNPGEQQRPVTRGISSTSGNASQRSSQSKRVHFEQPTQYVNGGPNNVGYRPTHQQI